MDLNQIILQSIFLFRVLQYIKIANNELNMISDENLHIASQICRMETCKKDALLCLNDRIECVLSLSSSSVKKLQLCKMSKSSIFWLEYANSIFIFSVTKGTIVSFIYTYMIKIFGLYLKISVFTSMKTHT